MFRIIATEWLNLAHPANRSLLKYLSPSWRTGCKRLPQRMLKTLPFFLHSLILGMFFA
jgi:hypothetical protein